MAVDRWSIRIQIRTGRIRFTAVTSQAKKHGPRARFLVRMALQLYLLASAFGFANLVFHNEGWRSWLLSGASALTMAAGLALMVVVHQESRSLAAIPSGG